MAYAFMKSSAQEGRHGCSLLGPSRADTLTCRLTGVDGTRLAKCTRSMMNRRGPVIGRMLPCGSCIHAPQRDGTSGPDGDPRAVVRGGARVALESGSLTENGRRGKPKVAIMEHASDRDLLRAR